MEQEVVIRIIAAAFLVFMMLDWLWWRKWFAEGLDKHWLYLALASVAAGWGFSGIGGPMNLEDLPNNWALITSLFFYALGLVIVAIGLTKFRWARKAKKKEEEKV